MRLAALFLGGVLAAAVSARVCGNPCGGKCMRAISESPELGEAFCSAYLALEVTKTVTAVSTATSILTNVETTQSLETITASTSTSYASTTVISFLKRQAPTISAPPSADPTADPTASIISVCYNNKERISSACGCFLSTPVTASTLTVFESSTSTYVSETTTTTTELSTTAVTAVVSATPSIIIPKNVIPNGAFEQYISTSQLRGWESSSSSPGGQLDVIYPLSVCSPTGDCPGGSVIIRAYPPKDPNTYLSIKQSFVAKPNTQYRMNILMRCLNYDQSSGMRAFYNAVLTSTAVCANGNFNRVSLGFFTTDATGVGELEIRFLNGNGLDYLYYYADDVRAEAVEILPTSE